MNSWTTITNIGSDLDTYLANNYTGNQKWIFEYDFETEEALLERKDIPGIRFGLFEQPEDVLSRVEANSAYDINQAYLLQLFFVVARIQDFDKVVEKELLTMKDHIYDWSFNINAATVTNNELLTFEWVNIANVTRQDRYSLLEINFEAFRQTRL